MPKPVSKLPRTEVTPEPALEKRTRRRFSAAYKLRIVSEADRCQRGELSGLLRREHLYSSQLQQWRHEFAENGTAGLHKSSPGPAPSMTPEQRFIPSDLNLFITCYRSQSRRDSPTKYPSSPRRPEYSAGGDRYVNLTSGSNAAPSSPWKEICELRHILSSDPGPSFFLTHLVK